MDTTTQGAPGWWLAYLLKRLKAQAQRADRLETYLDGTNGIPVHADKALRDAYRRLMAMARTNFGELVVEAVRERMVPLGFRTGAGGDENGDADAWRIWQSNFLDADSALVHRAQLGLGDGYVIVGPPPAPGELPIITPEDPREVITAHDPVRKRETIAALKVFRDDVAGVDRAYLYLPGAVIKLRREIREGSFGLDSTVDEWKPETGQLLPAKVVPVVRFANRPKLNGCSVSELEPHLGILDRINYTVLSRLEIATLQAFRQRALKGGPQTDENGNEIDYDDIFRSDPGAFWHLPEGAELWESGVVDLGPIRNAVRDDVQDLAATSRTPLFYLTPEAANGSAEGAALAREGLVFKTQDRLTATGEAWERVMSLAFLFAGDTERARMPDLEVIWASPERFSLAERYDAATKAQAAGVPWREVMSEILQFSPAVIARMEAERSADLLFAASLAQPGTVTPPAAGRTPANGA